MRVFICGILSVLSVATSFGVTAELGRIVIPAKSSTQTASAGLQKLSGRSGLLYIPTSHAEPLPLLILLHKAGGSASEWFAGGGSYARYAEKGRFIILAPESPSPSWGTGPKKWGTTIWRSIALWTKRLPDARSIATGSPLVGFPTARRTRFHLAWRTAMYSAT